MQQVLQNSTDSISKRLVIGGVQQTITAATAQVLSPGGSEIRAAEATGISGVGTGEVSLSISWAEADYTKRTGYKIVWSLTSGGVAHARDTFFSVVSRVFESELVDQDLYDEHPPIEDEAPAAGLVAFRNAAWSEIKMQVSARFQNLDAVGAIFNLEVFTRVHLYGSLSRFYFQNAHNTDVGSEDWSKYERFSSLYEPALSLAFQQLSVDLDGDGLMDSEDDQPQVVPSVRWGR